MVKDGSDAEASAIGSPDVIGHGEGFLMVYAQGGRAIPGSSEARRNRGSVGLAVSDDGVSWEKRGTVLAPAPDGAWDGWFLDTPCVERAGSEWLLFYFGDSDNYAPGGAIGLARSGDLATWPRASSAPVLSPGPPGSWDELWVESPSVRYDDDSRTFHMWYTGVDATWSVRTGHATSPDGLSWTKDPANPVLGERDPSRSDWLAWDGTGAGVASAFRANGSWHLFYASQSLLDTWAKARNPGIGVASSRDGSAFERRGSHPLFGRAETACQPDGPYNPSALYRDGRWYAWYETGYGFGLISAATLDGDW